MSDLEETSPGKIFTKAYEGLEKIKFDNDWVTEQEYYDNIHGKLILQPGEMKASYDDYACKRLIFVGTRLGVICIYDKYANQENNGYYHVNVPDCKNTLMQVLLPVSTIGKRDMVALLGSWDRHENNMGYKIENIFQEMEVFA